MRNTKFKTSIQALFLICLLAMLWMYFQGYDNSIGWEVTTSAEVINYPAIGIEGQLLDFQITGEKYLLTESYTGGRIETNQTISAIFGALLWLGLCIVLVSSSFLKRFGFLLALALFTLLINRLNIGDIGLFGIESKMALFIPFIAIAGPLFYFHEYRAQTSFLARLITLISLSAGIVTFGVQDHGYFLNHFMSHSLFSFSIAGLLFLLIIAEENIFVILAVITNGKGGKSNHLHFIFITLIYLTNLTLYYLNKSELIPNSLSFFDPFLLLFISSIVAFFTIRHKAAATLKYLSDDSFQLIFYGLGIILFSLLGFSFFQTNDAVYESFHYFILYFHLGFGFFFFLYIVINFIDPLIQGFEVFRIAYKEQHFPYVSARLGGLFTVLGFYFLSTQEAYDLLKSGYYVDLANAETALGNVPLADEYYKYASFLGYNTHYANYQLAWNYSDKGKSYLSKIHFEKAANRFPSSFAYLNYGNLDMEINPVKVQATLAQAAATFDLGEIKNNLGVLRMRNEEWVKALNHFNMAESSETWNQAPLLNKWAALKKMNHIDSVQLKSDYEKGNHGIKSNILLSVDSDSAFYFDEKDFLKVPILHRQSYLLNAAPIFSDDTLASLARVELETSTNGNYNDRLRKALVIHFYRKGFVNEAFKMLDYLQANSYQHHKAGFLNDIGKLALDQGAFSLANEYFERAIEYKDLSAKINRLEALAHLGRADEIQNLLLAQVNEDPGLTKLANQILSHLEEFEDQKTRPARDAGQNLNSLTDEQLIKRASMNAFEENIVIQIVNILTDRNNPRAYEIILEATEINPYSAELMKVFAFTALRQHVPAYAEEMLSRIKSAVRSEDYQSFLKEFELIKAEIENEEW